MSDNYSVSAYYIKSHEVTSSDILRFANQVEFNAADYLQGRIDNATNSFYIKYSSLDDLAPAEKIQVLDFIAKAAYGTNVGVDKIYDEQTLQDAIQMFQMKYTESGIVDGINLGRNGDSGVGGLVDGLAGKKSVGEMLRLARIGKLGDIAEIVVADIGRYQVNRLDVNNVVNLGLLPTGVNYASAEELSPTIMSWLDAIAYGELARHNKPEDADRYDLMYTHKAFDSYDWHPNQVNKGSVYSTAAGRYQFLYRTWCEAAKALNLKDFSPANQDRAAWYLAKRRGVTEDMIKNNPQKAFHMVAKEWASVPKADGSFAYSGQGSKGIGIFLSAYKSGLKRRS